MFFFFARLCWQLWCHTQVDCEPQKWLSNFHHNTHFFFLLLVSNNILFGCWFFLAYWNNKLWIFAKLRVYILPWIQLHARSSSPNNRIIKIRVLLESVFVTREDYTSLFVVVVFFFCTLTGAHTNDFIFRYFGHIKTAVYSDYDVIKTVI